MGAWADDAKVAIPLPKCSPYPQHLEHNSAPKIDIFIDYKIHVRSENRASPRAFHATLEKANGSTTQS